MNTEKDNKQAVTVEDAMRVLRADYWKEDATRLREQAAKARNSAQGAQQSSEYPRVGFSVYTELSKALEELADFTEKGPPARTENRRQDRQVMRAWALDRRALVATVESCRMACDSHDIGSRCPFGQPILVGHHSERKHRRMLARMHAKSAKGYELYKQAEELKRRAKAARNNNAIYSADDDALTRYRHKIEVLERHRAAVKAWNQAARKKGATWASCCKAAGWTEEYARDLLRFVRLHKEGPGPWTLPGWQTTNTGAEIRRCKKRIEEIESKRAQAEQAADQGEREIAPGVTVTTNADLLKLEIWFPGKPSEEVRALVKSWGFRWVRSVGCWSRNMGPNADACVKALAELLNKQEGEAA